ncbi:centrosomal protein of 104 kDa-like [Styela clava]
MPRKLGYSIVGSTGESEGYSARNLEEHSPTVAGWQTPRFCVYPQELIVQLKEPARLKKLQLLAHQYLIPTKVEFYIGGVDGSRNFKRLGYIYLSSNEKTGYKSRELKSVHVDTEGTMLKLVLHKNHLNKFNLYNQVSIMAFNIIGDLQSDQNELRNSGNFLNDSPHKNPDYISPMDDLAFDLYQDPEVARIIRRLDTQKNECVRLENFDAAKKMKQAIADLRKVGEKLARYELDKRKAVEDEDYDLAKSKKAQMEEYRLKVYQQLRNYGLVEEAGIPHYFEMENPLPRDSYQREEPPRHQHYAAEDRQPYAQPDTVPNTALSPVAEALSVVSPRQTEDGILSPQASQHPHHELEHTQELHDDSFQSIASPRTDVRASYDDKIIPALNKKNAPPAEEPPLDTDTLPPGAERNVPSGEPEPMSEKSIREASSAIDVFGLPLISGAYSKTFSFREDALLAMYKKLKELPPDTSKDQLKAYLRATVFILKRLIRDKVHSVFTASLQVLELLLTYFIPQHHLGKNDLSYTINQTLPKLIQKTGESVARARGTALDFIDKMSVFPNVRATHILPHTVVQPFGHDTATRLAQSRVEIVSRMIKSLGLEAQAFTAEVVMDFCMPALEHNSGAVRDATCQVIYQVYRLAGAVVKSKLPPDEPSTRKNIMYRNIFDEMDRIDGKPTKAELKAQRERETKANEKKKQAEIQELQSQIEQLRNVNAKIQPQKDTGKKQQPQAENQAAPSESQDGDDTSAYLDRLCIFCGEHDESFNDEGLDLHYWKNCPMLKRCEHCKQVVEISTYTDHLISECDKKGSFGKCNRCSEAINLPDLQKHVADKKCLINKADKHSRCPMCHKNIQLGEESWKSHLMGSGRDACQENPRRVPSLNRLKGKSEQSKTAGNASRGKKPTAGKH